jgi:WXG100 protein secretion system (Wss), protein EssA
MKLSFPHFESEMSRETSGNSNKNNFDIENINDTLFAVQATLNAMQIVHPELSSAVYSFYQTVLDIGNQLTIVEELKSEQRKQIKVQKLTVTAKYNSSTWTC